MTEQQNDAIRKAPVAIARLRGRAAEIDALVTEWDRMNAADRSYDDHVAVLAGRIADLVDDSMDFPIHSM